MVETEISQMVVPDNWRKVSEGELESGNGLTYEHDDRTLRGSVIVVGSEYQSFIVDGEGDYVVYPEEFEASEQAIERLRQHMEYYS